MKKIRHYLSNVKYMTGLTYKFAKGQYVSAAIAFVLTTTVPFVNILFPKYVLDELTTERNWSKLIMLLFLWATINGTIMLIRSIINIFQVRIWTSLSIEKICIIWNWMQIWNIAISKTVKH